MSPFSERWWWLKTYLAVGRKHGLEVALLHVVWEVRNVEVGGVLLGLPCHLRLYSLTLQLVDCGQSTGGRLEVHKSVSLAPVSCLVQYGFCRNNGTKPRENVLH